MKRFKVHRFSRTKCLEEIRQLGGVLQRHRLLRERAQVLRFFRRRPQLSAFIGSYIPDISTFDRLAFEYPLFGDFAADLVVGDSRTNSYCFIEFEDASPSSIFSSVGNRATACWSRRFEHGFGQVLDWFTKLDDMKSTGEFLTRFGSRDIHYHGLLVIGRTAYLDDQQRARLRWRSAKVLIDSRPVHCVTFDELYTTLALRLQLYAATR